MIRRFRKSRVAIDVTRKADFNPLRTDLLRGPFVGREWIIKRIGDWISGSEPTLFISGQPGTGKSSLAEHIWDLSEGLVPAADDQPLRPGCLHAVNFCRAEDVETVDAVLVCERIAAQLSQRIPGYLDTLVELQTNGRIELKITQRLRNITHSDVAAVMHLSLATRDDPYLVFHTLIREPIDKLRERGSLGRGIIVLIDGLDESVDRAPATRLPRLLVNVLQNPVVGLRFLITSRPSAITGLFKDCPQIDLTKDQPPDMDDIRLYVETRLLAKSSGDLNPSLAKQISRAAEGNYLYAYHVTEDLPSSERVKGEFDLPKNLAKAYESFLDRRIGGDSDHSFWHELARPVLGIIVQSRGPGLTPQQIASITGIPQSEVDRTILACASYLEQDQPGGSVRPWHLSFRDYLREPGPYNIYPLEATRSIVTAMLRRWAGQWYRCDESYPIKYLLAHFAELFSLQKPSDDLVQVFTEFISDPGFLLACISTVGVNTLLSDFSQVIVAADSLPNDIRLLYRSLARQAPAIRDISPATQAGFELQQLALEMVSAGCSSFAERIYCYLQDRNLRHFRTQWATSRASRQLAHIMPGDAMGWRIGPAALIPDGNRAVIASGRRRARVWDLRGGAVISEFHSRIHNAGDIASITISRDGKRALTCYSPESEWAHDGVDVWEIETGHSLAQPWVPWGAECAAINPDGTWVIVTSNRDAYVWDLTDPDSKRPRHRLRGHKRDITTAVITADGRRAVTGSKDGTVRVWDLQSGEAIHVLPVDTGTSASVRGIRALAVTSDCSKIVASAMDIHVWNGITGDFIATLPDRDDEEQEYGGSWPNLVVITPDDQLAITAAINRRDVWVWELSTCTRLHKLIDHKWGITSIAVDAASARAVTGSNDNTAKVWNIRSGECLYTLSGSDTDVKHVAISSDGQTVVTSSNEAARAWDLRALGDDPRETGQHAPITQIAITQRPWGALTASREKTAEDSLIGWNLETGERTLIIQHPPVEEWVPFLRDQRAAKAREEIAFEIDRTWTQITGESLLAQGASWEGYSHLISSEEALVITWDGSIKIIDPRTRVVIRKVADADCKARTASVAKDKLTFVTGSEKSDIRLWDATTYAIKQVFQGHSGPIVSLAFSPDNIHFISGSKDRKAIIWRVGEPEPCVVLGKHKQTVHVAVSNDGRYYVTTSGDVLRVWDITGVRLGKFKCRGQSISQILLPQDNDCVVALSEDGSINVCELPSCKFLGRLVLGGYGYKFAVSASRPSWIVTGNNHGDVACFQLVEPHLL